MLEALIDHKLAVLGVAAFLIGSAIGAFGDDGALTPGAGVAHEAGCAGIEPDWSSVQATRHDEPVQQEGDQARRLVRWTLDGADARRGLVDACVRVGTITVEEGTADSVEIRALVQAEGPDSTEIVRGLELDAAFAQSSNRVGVAVGQVGEPPAQASREGNHYQITLRIRVPAEPVWSPDLRVGTGEIGVSGLRTQEIRASVGTGEVEIDAQMARSSDVGFEVTGETGSGDVDIQIGPTEERSSREDRGPGDRGYARSEGYADKPVRIHVEATASIGDVDVTAS